MGLQTEALTSMTERSNCRPPFSTPNILSNNWIMTAAVDIIKPMFCKIMMWHWLSVFDGLPLLSNVEICYMVIHWWLRPWLLIIFVTYQPSLWQWMKKFFSSMHCFKVVASWRGLFFVNSSIRLPGTCFGQNHSLFLTSAWPNTPHSNIMLCKYTNSYTKSAFHCYHLSSFVDLFCHFQRKSSSLWKIVKLGWELCMTICIFGLVFPYL